MKPSTRLRTGLGALMLGILCLPSARADFELKDSQGRRILLKDDGTWRYLDASAASDAASEPAKPEPQAELRLEGRLDAPGGCRFEVSLTNNLKYVIGSLVPQFTIYRMNEVAHSTQFVGFGPVRSGDQQRRSLQFAHIGCAEIAQLQVHGADRCEMGDLHKFSDARGQCLARVQVLPSDLLRFEKGKLPR